MGRALVGPNRRANVTFGATGNGEQGCGEEGVSSWELEEGGRASFESQYVASPAPPERLSSSNSLK